MRPQEVAAVLAIFTAAWPSAPLDERTPDVWLESLKDITPEDALEAASRLVKSEDWFPTVHKFRDSALSFARARNTYVGLPSGERRASPEFVRETVAEIRAKLRGEA